MLTCPQCHKSTPKDNFCGHCGYKHTETAKKWGHAWGESERTDVVLRLRIACEEFGDNDWDESLHLADVLDKHLLRYIKK